MQQRSRRSHFHFHRHAGPALCALLFVSALQPAVADDYPARPVRLVVPFSAGAGVTDIMARLTAQRLGEQLGQQFVVDNRPGVSGIVGTEIVAKAPADGYTLLVMNVSFVVNPSLYRKLPYDSQKDFVPVTMLNSAPLVLVVNPAVPAKSVQELLALARARPGQLNYGSGGPGTTPHLSTELFKSLAGIDMTHVPYKGGAPALSDLVGGQIQVMIENMPGTMPFVRGGKLRALAVSSPKRSALEPELPTIAESGVPGYEVIGWNGIVAGAGTPRAIIERVAAATGAVMQSPDVRQRLAAMGAEPVGNTPAEFGAFLKGETARWTKVIRDKGIRIE